MSKSDVDVIKTRLLSTKDWKVKIGYYRRNEYENQRRDAGKSKKANKEIPLLPFGTNADLDRITKPKHTQVSSTRQNSRQTMTRFSRVFNKRDNPSKLKSMHGAAKDSVSTKDERSQMQDLSHDKTYFNRVLWDEHVRLLYLRSGKESVVALKEKPYLRLWMESLMNEISEKSRNLRMVLKKEINFLNNRYQVQRQLHFWQTLHSLTLDQLYHKKCQLAFRKKIRHDTLLNELQHIWNWFNNGLYLKVERATKPLIINVTNWIEKNVNAMKFKILTDLYYVRGLSLMHLKKFKAAFKCFRKDGEIGELSHLQVSMDRMKDNMGRIYAIKGNYKHAIKLWSERLQEVTDEKEKAWLCYGIGQCHALEHNYEKAIAMSYKCIKNAEIGKSYCWELNGNLLLANCSAVLGTMREANVRTNTLVSLKAINRAYQCAVFLANVSVIRKIVDIVVHIYYSFKDIDLTILEDVWIPSLMEYARKATMADAEKVTETKNMNISNAINSINAKKLTIKTNKNECASIPEKDEFNTNNINNDEMIVLKKSEVKRITSTIVNVCLDDIELHSICRPKMYSKTQMSLSFCNSPITAVEVVSSDEDNADILSDEWITENEDEDE